MHIFAKIKNKPMKIFSARKSLRRITCAAALGLAFCGLINLVNSFVGGASAESYPTSATAIVTAIRSLANDPFNYDGTTLQHGYRYNGSPANSNSSNPAEETTGGFYLNNRGNDGPDYSCSSLIYYGLVNSHVFQGEFAKLTSVSTKRLLYLLSERNDFSEVSGEQESFFQNSNNLQPGDILMNHNKTHTAIVSKRDSSGTWIIQATSNSDGKVGDSTSDGRELSESKYAYDASKHFTYWQYAYRYNSNASHDISMTKYCPANGYEDCTESDSDELAAPNQDALPARKTENTTNFAVVSTDGGNYEIRSDNLFSGVFEPNDIAFQNMNLKNAVLAEYDSSKNLVTNAADKMFSNTEISTTDKAMITYNKEINGGSNIGLRDLDHYFTLTFRNAVVFRRNGNTLDLRITIKDIRYQTAANSTNGRLTKGFGIVANVFSNSDIANSSYNALQLGALRIKDGGNLKLGAIFNVTMEMVDSNGNVVNDNAEYLFKFIGIDSRDTTIDDCAGSWQAFDASGSPKAKYAESITLLGGFEKHIWSQQKDGLTPQLQFVKDGSGLRVLSNGKKSDGTSYCDNADETSSSIGENSMLTGFLARGNLGAQDGVRFKVRTSLGNAQTILNKVNYPDIEIKFDQNQGKVRSNFWNNTVGGGSKYQYNLGEGEALTITPFNNEDTGYHFIKAIKISNRSSGEFRTYTLGDFKSSSQIIVSHGELNNSPNSNAQITLKYKGNGVVDIIFPAQYAFTGTNSTYVRAGQPVYSNYTVEVTFDELPEHGQNTQGQGPEGGGGVIYDPVIGRETQDPEEQPSVPTNYQVTFDSNGGTAVASQTVAAGGKATRPTDPTKAGFTFDGWYSGTSQFNFNTAINRDMTLYARWTRNRYTVTFNANGGTTVESVNKTHGATLGTLPTTTRSGYTLDGWYTQQTGGTAISSSTTVTANVTYWAHWTKNAPDIFTVTFDSNGGSAVAPQRVTSGDTVVRPANPTRTGYTFSSWHLGDAVFTFNTPITQDVTLKAIWTRNKYTVTFESNGGTAVTSQTVAYGNKATKPDDPARDGFVFDGWYSNSALTNKFNFGASITKNTNIYAKWIENEPRIYTILDGDEQEMYTDETGELSITASGDVSDLVNIMINGEILDTSNYSIESGSTILTLTADYLSGLEPGDYTVTFNYVDGSVDAVFTIIEKPELGGSEEEPDPNPNTNPDPNQNTDPDPNQNGGQNNGQNQNGNPDDESGDIAVPNTGDAPENPENPNTFDTIYVYLAILAAAGGTYIYRYRKNRR